MKRTNIYTDREKTIAASEFINANRATCYIRSNNTTNYYNVNGVTWSWWHEGTSTYPEIV